YTLAAEQGDAFAQFRLGMMYDQGRGVPQDDKTAVKWYRLAAEQGDASAQYNLGLMYRDGYGVPQDDKIAVKWFRLAAEQGDASAQSNLGVMYGFGLGVIQDHIYAHMWGNIAALNGNELGAKLRGEFEKKMTPAQIAEAQKLAREVLKQKDSWDNWDGVVVSL
ncbi:MAG: tetratricopeptide repeat protein, partial [Pseudomonadota bacterium]|nr:tetratricopeptide repeat protein [Pseudomonadota bacterium]